MKIKSLVILAQLEDGNVRQMFLKEQTLSLIENVICTLETPIVITSGETIQTRKEPEPKKNDPRLTPRVGDECMVIGKVDKDIFVSGEIVALLSVLPSDFDDEELYFKCISKKTGIIGSVPASVLHVTYREIGEREGCKKP